MEAPPADLRDGIRAGVPFGAAAFALAISFGVLAEPLMGKVAPIVMSVVVFAGASQFAALSVLVTGGGALAAATAGLLMNARFLPMSFAVAPSLRGGRLRRMLEGQTIVDVSFALANRGGGRFDRDLLVGSTIPQAICWMGGTAVGVFAGSLVGDPRDYGLDALFPAFFLALLVEELRGRPPALVSALLGAGIAFALIPVAPLGIAVLAASAAALVGLRGARA